MLLYYIQNKCLLKAVYYYYGIAIILYSKCYKCSLCLFWDTICESINAVGYYSSTRKLQDCGIFPRLLVSVDASMKKKVKPCLLCGLE